MPIFDMIFSTPLPSARLRFATASAGVMSLSTPRCTRSSTLSMAR